MSAERCDCLVIGAGPAGLAAAEVMLAAGRQVVICETKPSVARKLLMAGKSGLNLTKAEAVEPMLARFGAASGHLEPMLRAFDADAIMAWARTLGEPLFTGSSGRVFPEAMKASPLLRKWLARLSACEVRTRWRWTGWDGGDLRFETSDGVRVLRPGATVLALGGASWARLGSDGAWCDWLSDVPLSPFRPANVGLEIDWSPVMRDRFAGHAVKGGALSFAGRTVRGDFVVTGYGIEGGAVYALSADVRDGLSGGDAIVHLDLFPDRTHEDVAARLARPRGKASWATHLRKTLKLGGVRAGLVHEAGEITAEILKALPLQIRGTRPLDEAISSAGGIRWEAVDEALMLRAYPGIFAAGEMLDWEAPTGGYLLTGSLATGRWAGRGAVRWLERP